MMNSGQSNLFSEYPAASQSDTLRYVLALVDMYRAGQLGGEVMPEDAAPPIADPAIRACFFTLPMALNYQRNSYALWEAAARAYKDSSTQWVYFPTEVVGRSPDALREALVHHRVALQPTRHPDIWGRICSRLAADYSGSVLELFEHATYRVSKISENVRVENKKSFPYLSGPKIFNYWLYVMEQYCDIQFVDRENISVAPDTHVVQATLRLGLLESNRKSGAALQEDVAGAWKRLLEPTNLTPIDVHSALWLWSRGGFPQIVVKE